MVVTFYSYKGGVGRSMALANVAELLAGFGYRVIVCDWDLEAPGLERYFVANSADVEEYRRSMDDFLGWPGLVDLLVEYKATLSRPVDEAHTPDSQGYARHGDLWLRRPSSYAMPVARSRSVTGSVRLLTAGRRAGDAQRQYGDAVRRFDWQQFYDDWAGDAYMDFFRRDLTGEPAADVEGAADLLLIDSRTGVTEQGGVCTHHLADLVLVLTAANDLNMEGARWMVRALGDPQLVKARGGRPLAVLPIASRIEQTAQTKELVEFRRQFIREFGETLARHSTDPEALAIATEIPYMPYYSYHERVVAREQEGDREQNLYAKYRAIAEAIADYGVKALLLRERTAEGITAKAAGRGQRGAPAWNIETFCHELSDQLAQRSADGVARLMDVLEREVHGRTDAFPEPDANRILKILQRSRQFATMQAAAETFINAGLAHPALRLVYARSLVEQGNSTVALSILPALIVEAFKDPALHTSARMLLGRIYKQQYLESTERATPKAIRNLERAVNEYAGIYRTDPRTNLAAGINVVALAERARRDGVVLTDAPKPTELAAEIVHFVFKGDEVSQTVDGPWDWAIAAEAHLGLGQTDSALICLANYVGNQRIDNYQLVAFRRQLTDVWGLNSESEPGASMLAAIDAAILSREGGSVSVNARALPALVAVTSADNPLKAVFGGDEHRTIQWFRRGLELGQVVVRIDSEHGRPVGTGFLIAGSTLHSPLGPAAVLVTAAHVVSPDASVTGALTPGIATAVRPARDAGEVTHRIGQILFTSPPAALDVTVAEIDPPVTDLPSIQIAPPHRDPVGQRIVLIGHPLGQSLSLSDGVVVGADEPQLHYRSSVGPGTSGSPVFDDGWRLLAVHHMSRGPEDGGWAGTGGTMTIGEGISMGAIARELARTVGDRPRSVSSERAPERRRARIMVTFVKKDHDLLKEFLTHLNVLERQGLIETPLAWEVRKLNVKQADEYLRTLHGADIVVIMVTPEFLASELMPAIEIPRLVSMFQTTTTVLVPVIARPANWTLSSLAAYQVLPANGTAVTSWTNRDAAWAGVIEGISRTIDQIAASEKWEGRSEK